MHNRSNHVGVLGASAAFGRVLRADDDQAPAGTPVIVLSDGFWRGAFGAAPGVLGQTVRLGAKVVLFVAIANVVNLQLSRAVQRRREMAREIGVRLALGASPAHTTRLIVRQSLGWAVIGVVIGLGAAAAVGGFVQPLLFETSARDRVVYGLAAAALLAMAAAASAIPARRAGRVDPTVALQTE